MQFIRRLFKEDSTPLPAWNRWLIFYAVLLLVAGIRMTWNTEHCLDLFFFDETEYLYKGLRLASEQYNSWGPSYNVWYFLLSLIKSNPVELYYFNFKVIIILIPILLFFFLYAYEVSIHLSVLFALSYLMLNLHTANFTLVSHFCLICILIGFIAARFAEKNEHKLMALLTAAYICMYARQEFLIIVAGLLLLWLICVIQQRKVYASAWHLCFVIVVAGLYALFGFITFKGQGIDRSYFAFMQYFYANYILWSKKIIPLDQFNSLDLFKGSKTMFQCMTANPALFAKHVATNAMTYGISLYKYFEDFFLPKSIFHFFGKGKHILFGLLLIAFAYQLVFKRSYRHLTGFIKERPLISVAIFLFFGWSFFSIFMIYPNRHYIVLQFCWYLLILAFLLKNYWKFFDNKFIQGLLLVLLFVFIPTGKKVSYYQQGMADRDKQPNLRAVQYLIRHDPHKPVKILSPEKGFYAYLPANFTELFPVDNDINPYHDNHSFDMQRFITEKGINVIYMSERMQDLTRISSGNAENDIALHPEKFGFIRIVLDKNLKTFLLVKNGSF